MTVTRCGNCKFFHRVEGQTYHDCRESSPTVVVPSFKPSDNQSPASSTIGKIMTVWPRVSESEKGCGKFEE